ncbi:MAG: protein jag [Selenomonadaceae bacterium]|nr:protein jag [Selenomonadaceae bacterium]
MATVIEKTGKTIQDAINAAVKELGVAESDIEVEVLETPTKKFFGLLGGTPAKIRATLKERPPVVEPEPVKEIVTPVEEIVEPVAEVVEHVEEPVKEEIPAEEPAKEFEPILEPSPVVEEKSEPEPVDREQIVEAAGKFLQDVFAAMDLEVTIDVYEEGEEGYLLDLKGKNLGMLIGRRGQALDALQYLLNLAVNRSAGEKIHFTLDVEDYRRRREDTLIKLAKSVAERAIKTRKDVRLEPMNRHERKIIHTVLQENDRVETHSSGEEPYRYVIVTPVKRSRR